MMFETETAGPFLVQKLKWGGMGGGGGIKAPRAPRLIQFDSFKKQTATRELLSFYYC